MKEQLKKHLPTDDGIAMLGSIYENLQTLLVMFFWLVLLEIWWQVSDKRAAYSRRALMAFWYEYLIFLLFLGKVLFIP